jgi:hypothetical protein
MAIYEQLQGSLSMHIYLNHFCPAKLYPHHELFHFVCVLQTQCENCRQDTQRPNREKKEYIKSAQDQSPLCNHTQLLESQKQQT